MKRLFTLYRQPDLDRSGTTLVRKAYRAIIFEDGKLLLVHSAKYGEYKFPGGGQNTGESPVAVLRREVAEETGRRLDAKIVPFGSTMEYARDFEGKFDIFQQVSYYYLCRVRGEAGPTALEDYEIEYGYSPVWISPEEAFDHNLAVPAHDRIPWKERDTRVLGLLIGKKDHS